MAKELPHAGSVYAYCSAGITPNAGFLVGWLLLLDYLFIPAVAYLFSGISLNAIMPQIPVWLWTTLAVVMTTLLNLVGIKKSAKITLFILILEIIIIAAIIIVGITILLKEGMKRDWFEPFVGGRTFQLEPLIFSRIYCCTVVSRL